MRTCILFRFKQLDKETLGALIVLDSKGKIIFSCKTLELAFLDNRRNISSVPAGCYTMEFEYSPKFDRNLWELKDVPNRSECKIHTANFYRQLNGCIALGDMHTHINDDEYPDVRNSGKTLERFHAAMFGESVSQIIIIE